MKTASSWGNYPHVTPRATQALDWIPEQLPTGNVLAHGYGRSYGDVCLIQDGTLLRTEGMDRAIRFDTEAGVFACEAGMSLHAILQIIVPRGWFLPVSPGTQFVSAGGAVANDIHGKNHHGAGTFGRHVTQLELLRSDGSRTVCSPMAHAELFRATIGGLGLTGLMTWVEFKLVRIESPWMDVESIKYGSLAEFLALTQESDGSHAYTVAWVDASARGVGVGRGQFLRGNHAAAQANRVAPREGRFAVPFFMPNGAVNPVTVRAFNTAYYHRQLVRRRRFVSHYRPFFYPLDGVRHWNRVYGRRGFLQYQCVIPFAAAERGVRELLTLLANEGLLSFLSVLKCFGTLASPGMLSFPRPGVTLALDIPLRSDQTLRVLERCDALVQSCGGRVYPAKDARMRPETFQAMYPEWRDFARYIDPAFTSHFWERVTATSSI